MLLWISVGAALLYAVAYCHRPPSVLKSVVKTVPLLALAIYATVLGSPLAAIVALGLSALGDLALSRDGERAFLVGLSGFALAHLAYIVALSTDIASVDLSISLGVAVLAVLTLAGSTFFWLLPYTKELRAPVSIYVCPIASMGVLAVLHPSAVVTLGAVMFLGSDTLLALQLFRMPPTHVLSRAVSVLLWALYYGGQYLLWRGLS